MSQHVTIAALTAQQRRGLTPEQEQQMRAHLLECRQCAQLEEALAIIGKAPLPRPASPARAQAACLEPETFANYFNRKYFFYRRWQIQKHLAACANCRALLADLIRMNNTQLREEESAWLKTLPAFQPKVLHSRPREQRAMPAMPEPARTPLWVGIKSFFRTKPLPAFGLAFATVLLLAAQIGWPEFSNWQSRRLAQQGWEALAQQYTISAEHLRPAGKFQPRLLSGPRAPQSSSRVNAAEEKFQSSLNWNAASLLAQRGQALQAYFADDPAKAERILETLQHQHPNDAEVLNDLGVVAATLHSPEKALHYVEQALALHPNFPAARFNRADLLQRLNRRAEARQAWQEYLQLDEGADWQNLAELQRKRLE